MDVRSEEAANRRRRLLDAAIAVVGEVGADRLTMEMVAERADTATRTLYNHFSSRDELFNEMNARLFDMFRTATALELPTEGEPPERLRQFVTILFGNYERQGQSLTTLVELKHEGIQAQLGEMRLWRRQQLEQILRPAKSALRLPLDQSVALAFVMTNHVTWRALRDEVGLGQAKTIETTVTGLEAALFDFKRRARR
jgi:AcrR family transcriptional regulator